MSLRGHHDSTNMLVGTASFLVVRLGLSYWALPATGIRGILTQEAIDTESIRLSIERDIESLGSVAIGGNDVTIVALQRLGSAIQDTVTRYDL